MVRLKRSAMLWAMAVVVAVLATGCGGSSKSKGGTTTPTAAGAKGGTLITLANAAPAGSPDPQVNYTLQEWQWLILTHDGLVGYKRVGGTEGTKKVPDLATAIPKPTDNGKTWTFTLRPGIKFSNGNTVTGKDVKATFERLFKMATARMQAAGTTSSSAGTPASRRRRPAICRKGSSSTGTRSCST